MSYKDFSAWQKSMELAILVYQYTGDFPKEEQFGLISQMRRAAVSIPSNIAEGSRRTGKDLHHFLTISFGSGAELETQFELSRRLKYGDDTVRQKCIDLLEEVMKLLNVMTHNGT